MVRNEQMKTAEQLLESMWRFLAQANSDTSFWQKEAGYAVEISSPTYTIPVAASEPIHGIRELSSPLSDS